MPAHGCRQDAGDPPAAQPSAGSPALPWVRTPSWKLGRLRAVSPPWGMPLTLA